VLEQSLDAPVNGVLVKDGRGHNGRDSCGRNRRRIPRLLRGRAGKFVRFDLPRSRHDSL